MPVARPDTMPTICKYIMDRKPKTILDIGIGFGMYGFLARNYGVVWNNKLTQKQYNNWKEEIIVDGIEIYEPFITDLHRMIYNTIFIGDVSEIAPTLKDYELYIMGDVLEHLEKDDAIELINKLKKKGNLLIATPNYFHEGSSNLGNKYDLHKCVLEDSDFPDNPPIIHIGRQKVVIYE